MARITGLHAVVQGHDDIDDGAPVYYERHRPAQTTLYRLVQQHAVSLIAHTEASISGKLTARNLPFVGGG